MYESRQGTASSRAGRSLLLLLVAVTTTQVAVAGDPKKNGQSNTTHAKSAGRKAHDPVEFSSMKDKTPSAFFDLGGALSTVQFQTGMDPDLGFQLTGAGALTPEWSYNKHASARFYGVIRGMWASSQFEDDANQSVNRSYLAEEVSADATSHGASQRMGVLTLGVALRHFVDPRYFFDVEGGFSWDSTVIANDDKSTSIPWTTVNLTAEPAKDFFHGGYFGANFGVIAVPEDGTFNGLTMTGGLRFRRFESQTEGDAVYSAYGESNRYPGDGTYAVEAHFSVGVQFGPSTVYEVVEAIRPAPDDTTDDFNDDPDVIVPEITPEDDPPEPAQPPPIAEVVDCTLKVNTPILFATQKDEFLDESKPVIQAIADALSKHPEITLLELRGHTDDHGSDEDNLSLSFRRVNSVMKALIALGINSDRVTTKAMGETQLLHQPPTTAEQDAENRRVEYKVLSCDQQQ